MSTRNKVYLVLTSVVIVFMILLTGLYLNSHTKVKHHKTAESSEPSSSLVTSSSSSEEKVTKPSETKKEEEVKPTTSSSSETKSTETKEAQTSSSVEKKEEKPKIETKTENKSEDVKKATEEPARPAPAATANYRYVYEAVGGDDFSVVAELTGVDVDTLAQANSMSKDVVFKHGDRIFVP